MNKEKKRKKIIIKIISDKIIKKKKLKKMKKMKKMKKRKKKKMKKKKIIINYLKIKNLKVK